MRIFSLGKLIENQLKWGVFIAPKGICLLAAGKGRIALPVDRPVDQPNGHISDRCASGRPTWSIETGYREQSSLPVDRHGRPGPFPESRALWTVHRPVDRPTSHGCVHVLCMSVDRSGRPTSASVDRQTASTVILGFRNSVFLSSIKSHKIT